MEARTKTCGPLWFNFEPYPHDDFLSWNSTRFGAHSYHFVPGPITEAEVVCVPMLSVLNARG